MKISYRQQEGVILTQVCGEYLLVASREAHGKCPYVNRISPLEADYWKLMTLKKEPAEILTTCMKKYKISGNEMIRMLSYATDKFTEAGYFVKEITEEP